MAKSKAHLKLVGKKDPKESQGKPVCLCPDETWEGRARVMNDSLICMMDVLVVAKEELLKKESLTLNLEEGLLLLQALHLFLTRMVMALNIRKKNLVEAMMQNENGETFEHFMSLKAKTEEGDFCARLLGNISSTLESGAKALGKND